MTLYDFAKKYADLGWVVVPVKKGTKYPALGSWKKYQTQRPTDLELKEWFKDNNLGIGLICGKLSNVAVIDLDSYKKESGIKLDTPIRVKTGGGGLHGYFKYSDKIPNVVNDNLAVDIKSEGGFVVLPPTIHPSGKKYEWDLNGKLDKLINELPDFPEDIFSQVKKNPLNEPFNISDHVSVKQGSRNDSLYRTACSLLAKYDSEAAFHIVYEINKTYKPPLSDYEVQQLFGSANSFIDAQKDEITQVNLIREGSDLRFDFNPLPLSALSSEKAQVTWIWEGYIAKGHLTLFSALWKAGKSTLIAQLLKSIQSVKKLAGQEVTSCKVLVISEESESIWARRKDDLELDLPVWIVSRPVKEKLSYDKWTNLLKKANVFCLKNRIGLLVIDTVSGFWNVRDENNAADVQAALLPLNYLTSQNIGVLLVHHFRKSGGDEGVASRGSGTLGSTADILIEFTRKEKDNPNSKQRVLKTYSRFEESPAEIVIDLVDDEYITLGTLGEVSKQAKLDKILSLLPNAPKGEPVQTILDTWEVEEMGKKPSRSSVIRYLSELKETNRVKIVGEIMIKKTKAPLYGKTQINPIIDNANQPEPVNSDSEAKNATQTTRLPKVFDDPYKNIPGYWRTVPKKSNA